MAVSPRAIAVALALSCLLVPGAVLAGEGYAIELPDRSEVEVGSSGAVSLTIEPEPEHAISRDGPLRIELSTEPTEGLVLPERRLRRDAAADARAEAPRFDLSYRAEAAGQYRLRVEARFWVCRRHTCWPVVERRTVAITATTPAPPPDAGAD